MRLAAFLRRWPPASSAAHRPQRAALSAYWEALAKERLRDEPAFAGARAGEYGDAYFVRHGGRRQQFERHLKGSNARNDRRGFRLYFFWDEGNREVVVGWLPTHLPTRIS